MCTVTRSASFVVIHWKETIAPISPPLAISAAFKSTMLQLSMSLCVMLAILCRPLVAVWASLMNSHVVRIHAKSLKSFAVMNTVIL